jgi:tetratricopeptide (TPR) repeat protein
MSRAQLTFVIISSLVICSLIGGAFVSLTLDDSLGNLFSDDDGGENFEDPNEDIISAQETVVANNPNSVEDLLVLANLLSNTQRLGDAIPYYERVLELAPDDVGARVAFAQALAGGGLYADAEFQFERALEIDPNNQPAHYYLAEMFMAETPARTGEAIEHYWRVVEIDPTTLIAERAQTRLDTLGAGTPPPSNDGATPAASPVATP